MLGNTCMAQHTPLKGLLVLDFTRLVPGPFCSKILSDFGATVIKIEDTKKGDYLKDFSPKIFEESFFSVYLNKNKQKLKINFYTPEGQAVIKKLVKKADVLLESFRPGVMTKMVTLLLIK